MKKAKYYPVSRRSKKDENDNVIKQNMILVLCMAILFSLYMIGIS